MHGFLIFVSWAGWAVMLVALVLCFRSPQPGHKWLWALLVVFGTVQFALAPDQGAYRVVGTSVAVLRPAFFADTAADAAGVALVLPVGALIFLLRRFQARPRQGH